jgi:small subunit ribosomal protein S13
LVYILETKLLEIKSIFFALKKIYGIGNFRAVLICKKLGFSKNLILKNLSEEQILKIIKLIETLNFSITSDLKKLRISILKKLTFIKSYRGLRRIKGLPVRGQRTHTNGKSSKKFKIYVFAYNITAIIWFYYCWLIW